MPTYSKSSSVLYGSVRYSAGAVLDADVVQQQRVAVGRGARDLGGAERAAGAADVLDDHRLAAERLAHRLGEVARDLVGRAAGGERDDDRDRLVGILGEGRGRQGDENERPRAVRSDFMDGVPSWSIAALSRPPLAGASVEPPTSARGGAPQPGDRRSSITLPSLGRLPGTTTSTSPRSRVTSRIVRATCSPRPSGRAGLDPQRHAVVGPARPRRPAAPARSRDGGARSRRRRDGWTNMPRTLVDWSARPSQPRMRWLVRPVGQAPASTADRSPVAIADQRVVGVERRHDDLADLAVGDRIAGAGAHDLDDDALVDHQALARHRLVGDEAEVGRAVRLVGGDAARAEPLAHGERHGLAAERGLGQRRQGDAGLVGLLEEQAQEARRSGIGRRRAARPSPATAARSARCRPAKTVQPIACAPLSIIEPAGVRW